MVVIVNDAWITLHADIRVRGAGCPDPALWRHSTKPDEDTKGCIRPMKLSASTIERHTVMDYWQFSLGIRANIEAQ